MYSGLQVERLIHLITVNRIGCTSCQHELDYLGVRLPSFTDLVALHVVNNLPCMHRSRAIGGKLCLHA